MRFREYAVPSGLRYFLFRLKCSAMVQRALFSTYQQHRTPTDSARLFGQSSIERRGSLGLLVHPIMVQIFGFCPNSQTLISNCPTLGVITWISFLVTSLLLIVCTTQCQRFVQPFSALITRKNETTLGGDGTENEMCLNIISYYPALDAPWCLTNVQVIEPLTQKPPQTEMVDYSN